MFLEGIVSFYDTVADEESGKEYLKKYKDHVLCLCVNYTDAEALLYKYVELMAIPTENMEIGPIKECKIEKYFPLEDKDPEKDYIWFKCGCTYSVMLDNGKEKIFKYNILVEAEDSAKASIKATKLTQEYAGDMSECRTPKISETKILYVMVSDQKED